MDRVAAAEAELAPIFRALEKCQRQARAVVEEASAEAGRIRADADRRASGLRAEAEVRAGQVRSEAARSRLTAVGDQAHEVIARAQREAERIDQATQQQLPALVDRVVRVAMVRPQPRPRPDPR